MQHWTQGMEKQVGRRVQILLEDPVLLNLYKKFGAEIFRRSSVFHDLAKFLEQNNIRGKCAFEVGTWNGLTALVLSRFFDRVVTVDIADQPDKYAILKEAGVTNVQFIHIPNNDAKAGVLSGLDFDFAYLDGDHANDTDDDFKLVRKCGRVLFHEYWPFQPPVWGLVNGLPQDEVKHNGAGLALWRKA